MYTYVGLCVEPKSDAAAHSCTHAHPKMGPAHTHTKEAVQLPNERLTCAQCNTHAMAVVQVLKPKRNIFAATSLCGWRDSHAKMKERSIWIGSHLCVAATENRCVVTRMTRTMQIMHCQQVIWCLLNVCAQGQ